MAELARSTDRRLGVALAINIVIVVAQVLFGVLASSLGLLADAGHNLTDVAALALSLMAVRLVRREPNRKQTFGYHLAGVLVAQANAGAILVATGLITFEGVRRLIHPEVVDGLAVTIVAAVALVGNALAMLLLREHGGDLNLRSAALHMAADAASSAGVVIAGVVIATKHANNWLDPAVSLLIGAVIAYRAVRLLMETTAVLMESAPATVDLEALTASVKSMPQVEDIHDVHAWSLSNDLLALSAHVVMAGHPSLAQAQLVADEVKHVLTERFHIAHATLELECEECVDDTDDACAMPGVQVPLAHAHHH